MAACRSSLFFIKRFARKHNIKLLHDSVEWYSPEQFKFGRLSPSYILKDLNNRVLIDENFKVIAISKYLENHFNSRGIEAARIPVIMDIRDLSSEKHTRKDKLTIMYAGSPGKKDFLKEIIEGISFLNDDELKRIELRLIGITEEQIINDLSVSERSLNKIKNSFKTMGRVPREVVLENLKQADFTVLLRSPVQRYAKAGFPTKVVESLASGTPVMLNITSDLGDYIIDNRQGLIVKECSAESLCKTIRRALALTDEDKEKMYQAARKCAEENFDYRKYEETLGMLMQ